MDRLAPHTELLHTSPAREPQTAAVGKIDLITTLPALLALEQDWRALEAVTAKPVSVFQSFDWISAWCQTYCTGNDGPAIHVIAGYDKDRLVFLWPLATRRRLGLKMLSWLTEPFGQYGDVICAAGEMLQHWIAGSLKLLRHHKGFDILRLRHVREDSMIAAVAAAEFRDARLNERAPFLDLTAFQSEADYDARYSQAQRKRRKKIRKTLEERGPVSFTALPLGSLSDGAITQALSEKSKWLAERGRINRVLGCPKHVAFLQRLSRVRPQGLHMIVSELKAGDRPVSWEIGFRFAGTHFTYITSHVNALTDFSPGRLHMDLSQRAALAAGQRRFDLMVPYDAYKESWSSGVVATRDYYLPFSFRGKTLGHAYLSYLRPALRAIYYRLPQNILRLINPVKTG